MTLVRHGGRIHLRSKLIESKYKEKQEPIQLDYQTEQEIQRDSLNEGLQQYQ